MTELLPPGFLFRVALPVKRIAKLPAVVTTAPVLGAEFELPNVGQLSEDRGDGPTPAAYPLRVGWHEQGLAFQVEVAGKNGRPKCDTVTMLGSEGLQVWLDTRNTQNIHRASRFCHHFAFLPGGGGRDHSAPVGRQILIARAREASALCDPKSLVLNSEIRDAGYTLRAWIPAECLTGYAPDSSPHLGFYFMIRDHQLGDQVLSVGPEFPFDQDPSLWWTLDLISKK